MLKQLAFSVKKGKKTESTTGFLQKIISLSARFRLCVILYFKQRML